MPLFDFSCDRCAAVVEETRSVADMDNPAVCGCGGNLKRVFAVGKQHLVRYDLTDEERKLDKKKYSEPRDEATRKRWDEDCIGSCRWV